MSDELILLVNSLAFGSLFFGIFGQLIQANGVVLLVSLVVSTVLFSISSMMKKVNNE